MITPASIEEFGKVMSDIEKKVKLALHAEYPRLVQEYGKDTQGNLKGPLSIGSCVIYADRRKALGKFLKQLVNHSNEIYGVHQGKDFFTISLRALSFQQYTLRNIGYEIVVKELKAAYGWEIFNDVRVD